MDMNFIVTGIIFILVGFLATTVDSRLTLGGLAFGVLSIIIGLVSKSEKTAPQPFIPLPTQPFQQPPQQVVRTLVICPKCGNRVSAEAKFCPECGANLMPGKPQPA